MRFKTGALGICVIIIAISATLLGSWVMSMDVNENEVTKYKSLTDITGLFESEQTPTFTDYSPSTNYTGYYTEDSTVGETRYFDGVDYTASANPNNYRLNLAPINTDTGTLTLTDAEDTEDVSSLKYWRTNAYPMYPARCSTTITKLIATESWDLDELIIVCQEGSWTDGGFTCIVTLGDGDVMLKDPDLTGVLYETVGQRTEQYDAARIPNPIMACKYYAFTNEVTLYYDTEMTQVAGVSTGDKTAIMWSNGGYFFGDEFTYTLHDLPPATYMDPSKGVELDE